MDFLRRVLLLDSQIFNRLLLGTFTEILQREKNSTQLNTFRKVHVQFIRIFAGEIFNIRCEQKVANFCAKWKTIEIACGVQQTIIHARLMWNFSWLYSNFHFPEFVQLNVLITKQSVTDRHGIGNRWLKHNIFKFNLIINQSLPILIA